MLDQGHERQLSPSFCLAGSSAKDVIAIRAVLPPYRIEHEVRRRFLLGAKHSAATSQDCRILIFWLVALGQLSHEQDYDVN